MSTSDAEGVNVDSAISELGFGPLQVFIMCLTGLVFASELIEVQLLSFMGQRLHCVWSLDNLSKSALTSAGFLGMLVGSVGLGWTADKFGRRDISSVGAILVFVFGCLTSLAPNFISLLVIRLIVGICLGASVPAWEAYGMEFLPVRMRGRGWYIMLAFEGLGGVFETLVAWSLMYRVSQDWRWIALASAAPFLPAALVYRLALPRSPRYCLLIDRHDEAVAAVNRIARSNKKAEFKGRLVTDDGSTESGKPWLVVKYFPTQTLLLFSLFFTAGLGYFSIMQLNVQVPLVLSETCGTAPHKNGTSSRLINEKCERINFIELLPPAFSETTINLLTCFLIEPLIGRKTLLVATLCITALLMPLLPLCIPSFAQTILFFVLRMSSASAYTVVQLLALEFYPTTLRVTANSLLFGAARFAIVFSPLLSQYMVTDVSPVLTSIIFCAMYTIATIVTLLFAFETKGKALMQTADDVVHESEVRDKEGETIVLSDSGHYGSVPESEDQSK